MLTKKSHSRMYCLRKLRSFNVQEQLLQTFYTAVLSSVMSFGLVCWGGGASKQDRNRVDKQIKKASGVVGKRQDDISTLHDRLVTKKLTDILTDNTHPLYDEFHNYA